MSASENVILPSEFGRLVIDAVPMIDLRAPIEFDAGAIPGAISLPILDDIEREKVGKTYAESGPDDAVTLGHTLVSGCVKQIRVNAWVAFAKQYPAGCLYCFRGGMRSIIAQGWLRESGVDYARVAGGYKAVRRFLSNEIERAAGVLQFQVLGGRTGVGKTRVLCELSNAIDLEALANHRGSAFGAWPTPRSRAQNFENALGVALLTASQQPGVAVVLEDEGTNIGGVSIPPCIATAASVAPLVILESPLHDRVQETLRGYITDSVAAHLAADPEDGFQRFADQLLASLFRIRQRLGGQKYDEIKLALKIAINAHQRFDDTEAHCQWIKILLEQYYDPMYDYQLERKDRRIQFRGNHSEVIDWFLRHREVQ